MRKVGFRGRRSRRHNEMVPMEESMVERLAKIVGPCSAAQMALDDAAARRARGEQVAFFTRGDSILVGPPLQTGGSE